MNIVNIDIDNIIDRVRSAYRSLNIITIYNVRSLPVFDAL